MPIRTNGPGKYDAAATVARASTKAKGVLLVVFGGEHGAGFSAQLPADLLLTVPAILRDMADQIDRQLTES
jgi:hypothetical protein